MKKEEKKSGYATTIKVPIQHCEVFRAFIEQERNNPTEDTYDLKKACLLKGKSNVASLNPDDEK